MAKKYQLPKFERPSSTGLLKRARLFDELDAIRDKRVIWVSSPAGTGKTSLLSSYLDDRNRNVLWYQIDAGDSDVASFFYYMGLCLKNAYPKKKNALSPFTKEYQFGLLAFSVAYFRELFSKVEENSVVLLDDYHESGENPDLSMILSAAIKEVPKGCQLIVLSRTDPPSELSAIQTSTDFCLLSFRDLQLRRAESDAIANIRKNIQLKDSDYELLYELTQGWAAGLILLIFYISLNPEFLQKRRFNDRNALFDYLANEVYSRLDAVTQSAMLKICMLKRVPLSTAKKLCGSSSTKHLLQNLQQSQLIMIRHDHLEESFEFHPLFREFLLGKSAAYFSSEEQQNLFEKAAALLLKENIYHEAVELYSATDNWSKIVELVLSNAGKMIEQGLFRTVERWINYLPNEYLEQNVWLAYWDAYCLSQYKPIESRTKLELVHEKFLQESDRKGVFLTWCNLVESYFQIWDTLVPMKTLIIRYYNLVKKFSVPGVELKGRIAVNLTSSMLHTWVDHEDYPKWLSKTEYAYLLIPNKQVSALVGSILGTVYYVDLNIHKLRKISKKLDQLLEDDKITPLLKHTIYYALILKCVIESDQRKLASYIDSALTLSERSGVRVFDPMFQLFRCHYMMMSNNPAQAYAELNKMTSPVAADGGTYGFLLFAKGRACLDLGNYDAALSYFQETEKVTQTCGFSYSAIELLISLTMMMTGNIEGGIEILQKFQDRKDISTIVFMKPFINCFLSFGYHLLGNERTMLFYLEKGIQEFIQCGISGSTLWSQRVFNELAAIAWQRQIEPTFLKKFIRRNNLVLPEEKCYSENWPWPVKISTFGGFRVYVDGDLLNTGSRPFELLLVLISMGGKEVPENRIIDVLWPDSEGDQAQSNYKTTLHRLRKSFDGIEILIVKNKTLTLDRQYCWVDYLALEHNLDLLDTDSKADITEKIELCMEIYSGHFLSQLDESWVVQKREAIKSKFIRTIEKHSQRMETENYKQSIDWYLRLLEKEPMLESAYQGLIRCYASAGQDGDVAMTINRCLSVLKGAGTGPSQQLRKLIDEYRQEIH